MKKTSSLLAWGLFTYESCPFDNIICYMDGGRIWLLWVFAAVSDFSAWIWSKVTAEKVLSYQY